MFQLFKCLCEVLQNENTSSWGLVLCWNDDYLHSHSSFSIYHANQNVWEKKKIVDPINASIQMQKAFSL